MTAEIAELVDTERGMISRLIFIESEADLRQISAQSRMVGTATKALL
jgi:hypothetical protein